MSLSISATFLPSNKSRKPSILTCYLQNSERKQIRNQSHSQKKFTITMFSPQILRAIRWRTVINTDYDGAVLVGGLENELRHFGDPDEERDSWSYSEAVKPCPYTHEGARAIAAEEKKKKQEKLRAARRAAILGISHYENDANHVEIDEAVGKFEEDEEDGCTVEGSDEPLEFCDDWFSRTLQQDGARETESGNGLKSCSILQGEIIEEGKGSDSYEWDKVDMAMESIQDSGVRTYEEDDDSDFDSDLGYSLVSMFDEEAAVPSNQACKGECSCGCDSGFVEIEDTSTMHGLNGVEKTGSTARAVIAAQPGLWKSMIACRPFERARRPHIVRPGSWQAV
ncbi:uncharacterized protein EAE97_006275 [Botrytis byssoidea]|uniref:Uncharacterized protein n=1 Tax=Botrytis byssoidea TaxID=139641 RepID=A0A9P5M591_9HELO|nr:uncharacterized protein EAE97_006275 [Botrytis byssoidea]KAF7942821.1 hypothetical protein EAE97_006275 [Botrytis byssoidea]